MCIYIYINVYIHKDISMFIYICICINIYLYSLCVRSTARSDSSAVEAVLKMWPPPAPTKDPELEKEKDAFHAASSQLSSSSISQPARTRPPEQPFPQRNHQPQPDANGEIPVAPGPPGQSHYAAAAAFYKIKIILYKQFLSSIFNVYQSLVLGSWFFIIPHAGSVSGLRCLRYSRPSIFIMCEGHT